MDEFIVKPATEEYFVYAEQICKEIEESAKARGTGIAKRQPEYIRQKMKEGKAIIALHSDDLALAGFCYIESWGHDKFVANSGLIVVPRFRMGGLATRIKEEAFNLSRKKFPQAKLFGLTTSPAVIKINSELGYKKVQFAELTDDADFWKGCSSCVNYDILQSTNQKHCLCTGMLFDAQSNADNNAEKKTTKIVTPPLHLRQSAEKESVSLSSYELDEVYI